MLDIPPTENIVSVKESEGLQKPDCEKMIPVLEKIEDRQYANAANVTQAAVLAQ